MAIGLFIFAIIIQKFTFSSPKDIPAHIDELQVVGTAINIYNGSINPEFFRYPSGHINLLALLYIATELILGDLSISDHYQIAWYLSNLYMAMIPVLVYVMCQLLFSQNVGVLGGLISSISPLLLYHSQYSIVDIPMTFYVTLFFTYAAYCYKNNKLGNNSLMILGTITGIAISMKYTAGLLIPPLLLMSYNYNQSRRTYFLSDKYLEDIDKSKIESGLVLEWRRLIEVLWNNDCIISPKSFTKKVLILSRKLNYSVVFGNYSQNDVQEFLLFMINTLHDALSSEVIIKISGKVLTEVDKLALEAMKAWKEYFKNSYSIFVELFYGQFVSKRISPDSMYKSYAGFETLEALQKSGIIKFSLLHKRINIRDNSAPKNRKFLGIVKKIK